MTIRGVQLYPVVGTVGGTAPTGTGTAGQGAVWTGTTIVEDGSGLVYDNQATPVLRSVAATEMTAPTPTVTPHVAGKGTITTTTVAARAYGTIECIAAASRATGTITCVEKASLVDGETLTIDDGSGAEVFEFDVAGDGVTGGNVQVNVSTDTTAGDVAARLTTAINATFPTIAVDNLDGTISLVSNALGTAGNVAITHTVAAVGFAVSGMSTAVDGIEDGDTVVIEDGTSPAVTFEFDTDSSTAPGAVAVTISEGNSRDDVAAALDAAINGVGAGLLVASTPITATPHVLELWNSQYAAAGNVAITSSAALVLVGMSGGQGGILDGETLTLDDGTTAYVFEFDTDSTVTAGRTAITVGEGMTANDARDALVTAINGTAILMTASSGGAGTVNLEMDAGAAGGTNSETVAAAAFGVTGMTVTAATTWAYKVVAKLADGTQTSAGSAGNTAAGAASLDGNEYNTISWLAVTGASSYDVYRTTAGASPATTGKIGNTTALAINDTGLVGDGSTAPTQNQTGLLSGAATRLATTGAPVVISSAAPPSANQVLVAAGPVAAAWAAITGSSSSGQVLYNSGGAIAGDSGLTYNAATGTLSTGALTATSGGSASLGAELLTNAGFDSDLSSWTPGANWAWNAGTAQHTAGSTATITQSVSVTSGNSYQVSFVIIGRTAGSISVALGAVALNASGVTTWTASNAGTGIVAGASGSVALTITPTTDFDGSLDSVSIKLITASSPAITINDGGVTAIAVRGSATLDNTFVGDMAGRMDTTGTSNIAVGANALSSNTTGGGNSAVGTNALYANTTGDSNSAVGLDALRSNTTGGGNSAVGVGALYANTSGGSNSAVGTSALYTNTTGDSNSAVGFYALRSNTTGGSNSAVGVNALRSNTTGSNNTASGKDAGYASGASPSATNAVTTGSNNTFVGYQSGLGSATQRSNSTAIGSGAYVDADNTVVLGNASVTDVLMGSTAGAYANAAGLKSPTATHQLGGANSATPVAQTLQAQGARGGTDVDTPAAAAFTIIGPRGTGTGTAGSVVIQGGTPQTTGSVAHPPSTIATFKDSGSAGTSKPQVLLASGIPTAPALAFSAFPGLGFSVDGTGDLALSTVSARTFYLLQPGNLYTHAFSSTGQLAAFQLALGHTSMGSSSNIDVFLTRAAAATLQFGGANSATPVAQTLQAQGARGGTDTNVKGANFTARAGAGTGSAGGGDYRIQRYPAGSSGTTANTPSDALVIASKQVTLTESSATPVLDISVASGTVTGGTLWYTIRADDGADLQALRGQVQFAAVNKGGTITVIPSTPEETTAPSAGTLTNTVTITTGTNMITLNLNAVSSLTQTTLVAYISAQIDGLGTVTTK